jgi:isoquinoline 1-oxidoreductase alpha subunit
VLLDGKAQRACVTPVDAVSGREVTTIEGLAGNADLHPLQQAWIDEDVAQCGYCQPGQIMMAASLLRGKASPTEKEVEEAMNGNLCRCGTYPRIRRAIQRASRLSAAGGKA